MVNNHLSDFPPETEGTTSKYRLHPNGKGWILDCKIPVVGMQAEVRQVLLFCGSNRGGRLNSVTLEEASRSKVCVWLSFIFLQATHGYCPWC